MAPLDGVIADMQVAGGRLAKKLTDKPTQQKEKEAMEKLGGAHQVARGTARPTASQASRTRKSRPRIRSSSGPGRFGPLHDANRRGRTLGPTARSQARANPAVHDRRISAPLPENPRSATI